MQEREKPRGLKRSLNLIYVYIAAMGTIFTWLAYWDSQFFKYTGAGTFIAFALMACCILPIGYVYAELSSIFKQNGGELIYNTVGLNKNFGFFSSWLMLAAWVSVPPASVMGITAWLNYQFKLNLSFLQIMLVGVVLLLIYFFLSTQDINVLIKAQGFMLICNIGSGVVTAILLLFSGHWSFANFHPLFSSQLEPQLGIPSWIIGMALLIAPFFGFETIPEMVEEGIFPIKKMNKAIRGVIFSCAILYTSYFFIIAGIAPVDKLLNAESANGFMTIMFMQNTLGWHVWPLLFGIFGIVFGMGATLLGFWIAIVRLLYAMGEQNYLPKSFTKVNKHQQPILPNIFLLVICTIFIFLQNSSSFLGSFFNMMAFGVACAYVITMISAIRIHKKHPNWATYHTPGGQFTRVLALIIAITIMFFTGLGQDKVSWMAFGLYIVIGFVLWLYMKFFRWNKTSVTINTPDGKREV